jgi:hypothetical protein
MSAERHRALRLLAGSPLGCTEAIMLAHGFTVEVLRRLVLDGLATATPGTVQAGGRRVKVTWLRITDVGRQASPARSRRGRWPEIAAGIGCPCGPDATVAAGLPR